MTARPIAPARPAPSVALALGGGGARGLAHIAVLEAFDELGIRPAAIAGASIGAIVGAAYAAGVPAKALRTHALEVLRDRPRAMARLIEARVGRFVDILSGLGNPLLVDGERILEAFWPQGVPKRFEDLVLPFQAIATDYFGHGEAVLHTGPLAPAVAASMAIPGLVKPVKLGEHLFVDGGAVNPLPFDHVIGRADIVVAVDVSAGPTPHPARLPNGFEIMLGAIQIMQEAIVTAKLKIYRPQIVLRPAVARFRALDFFEAKAILAAAQPAKDELKRELERHVARGADKSIRPTRRSSGG